MRNWKSFCKTPWLNIYYCSAVFHPQRKFTFSWKKKKAFLSLENKQTAKSHQILFKRNFFLSHFSHCWRRYFSSVLWSIEKSTKKKHENFVMYKICSFRYFFFFSNVCFMSGVLNTLGPLFCKDIFSCMKFQDGKLVQTFLLNLTIFKTLISALKSFFLSKKLPVLIKQELTIISFFIVGIILLK